MITHRSHITSYHSSCRYPKKRPGPNSCVLRLGGRLQIKLKRVSRRIEAQSISEHTIRMRRTGKATRVIYEPRADCDVRSFTWLCRFLITRSKDSTP